MDFETNWIKKQKDDEAGINLILWILKPENIRFFKWRIFKV